MSQAVEKTTVRGWLGAVAISAVVGLAVAFAIFTVSWELFDGGTDQGNRIAAIVAGVVLASVLIWIFQSRGMHIALAFFAVAAGWGTGFVLLIATWLFLLWEGCRHGGCI